MLKLVTPPTTDPISLAEAREHLREDGEGQNASIVLYISAATRNAEAFLGRALVDQTWDYYIDGFPSPVATNTLTRRWPYFSNVGIALPLPPLIEVVGVFYRDADGVEQEMATSDYEIDYSRTDASVVLPSSGSWPTVVLTGSNAVRIRFRAGYVDGNSPALPDVPSDIKAAILLNIGNLYANRETIVVGLVASQLPWGVEALLRPHRVALGMA